MRRLDLIVVAATLAVTAPAWAKEESAALRDCLQWMQGNAAPSGLDVVGHRATVRVPEAPKDKTRIEIEEFNMRRRAWTALWSTEGMPQSKIDEKMVAEIEGRMNAVQAAFKTALNKGEAAKPSWDEWLRALEVNGCKAAAGGALGPAFASLESAAYRAPPIAGQEGKTPAPAISPGRPRFAPVGPGM